jgi:hypothetical protein
MPAFGYLDLSEIAVTAQRPMHKDLSAPLLTPDFDLLPSRLSDPITTYGP